MAKESTLTLQQAINTARQMRNWFRVFAKLEEVLVVVTQADQQVIAAEEQKLKLGQIIAELQHEAEVERQRIKTELGEMQASGTAQVEMDIAAYRQSLMEGTATLQNEISQLAAKKVGLEQEVKKQKIEAARTIDRLQTHVRETEEAARSKLQTLNGQIDEAEADLVSKRADLLTIEQHTQDSIAAQELEKQRWEQALAAFREEAHRLTEQAASLG